MFGGLSRRPYGILIAGIWTSPAEKVADMAENWLSHLHSLK